MGVLCSGAVGPWQQAVAWAHSPPVQAADETAGGHSEEAPRVSGDGESKAGDSWALPPCPRGARSAFSPLPHLPRPCHLRGRSLCSMMHICHIFTSLNLPHNWQYNSRWEIGSPGRTGEGVAELLCSPNKGFGWRGRGL